jgi:hypothetical protein
MYEGTELEDYLFAIREQVCTHCIDRPPGGPPCAPLGKRCGIEVNLARLVDAVHAVRSPAIDPYIAEFHDEVCTHCSFRPTNQCPCPLDHLLMLAVGAIEDVDQQRAAAWRSGSRQS